MVPQNQPTEDYGWKASTKSFNTESWRCRERSLTLAVHARNHRPKRAQFFDNALITPVNVIYTLDDRFALRNESRENKPRARTQIRSLNCRAGKRRRPVNHGAVPINRNVRSHAHHFARMKKPVLKNRFVDCGSAFRLRRQ